MRSFMVLILLLATQVASCSRQSSSEARLETLDALAATSTSTATLNQCGAQAALTPDATLPLPGQPLLPLRFDGVATTAQPLLRREVLIALTSVPKALQTIFMRVGGTIKISAKAGDLCRKNFTPDSAADSGAGVSAMPLSAVAPSACFMFSRNGSAGTQSLQIVVAPSAAAIRHGMVRVFGYLLAEFFSRMTYSVESTSFDLYGTESPSSLAAKAKLANTFLADLAVSGSAGLSGLAAKLGNVDQVMVNYRLGNADLLSGVAFQHATEKAQPSPEVQAYRRQIFASHVMAEAFDSWNCRAFGTDSLNTRAKMQKLYPGTYALYQAMLPAMAASLERLAAVISAPHSTASLNTLVAPARTLLGLADAPSVAPNTLAPNTLVVNIHPDGTADVEGKPKTMNVIINEPPPPVTPVVTPPQATVNPPNLVVPTPPPAPTTTLPPDTTLPTTTLPPDTTLPPSTLPPATTLPTADNSLGTMSNPPSPFLPSTDNVLDGELTGGLDVMLERVVEDTAAPKPQAWYPQDEFVPAAPVMDATGGAFGGGYEGYSAGNC